MSAGSGRRCGCGCGGSMEGRPRRALYIDHRHAQRAYRKRLAEQLDAAGLPRTLSLQTVETANYPRDRNGDAPAAGNRPQRRSRKPSAPRISLRKALRVADEVVAVLDGQPVPPAEARRLIETVLQQSLSDRQRELLVAG